MKPIFPGKQFSFSTTEAWERKLRNKLMIELDDKDFYPIKFTGGSRMVERSVYIDHLVAIEDKKRRDK